MKLKFVAIPAKRAAETDYGYLDEGDEVLKCFDLSRYATLFGFVAWAFENLARHADAHALFLPRHIHGRRWGKLPWRKMLRYSGRLGKKTENPAGEEHGSHHSPKHKRWVADLASKLLNNGMQVVLGRWGLRSRKRRSKVHGKELTAANR